MKLTRELISKGASGSTFNEAKDVVRKYETTTMQCLMRYCVQGFCQESLWGGESGGYYVSGGFISCTFLIIKFNQKLFKTEFHD